MTQDARLRGEESVQVRLPARLVDRVRRDANGNRESVRKFVESALWASQGVTEPVSVKRFGATWRIIDVDGTPLDQDEFTFDDKAAANLQSSAINSAIADEAKGVDGG